MDDSDSDSDSDRNNNEVIPDIPEPPLKQTKNKLLLTIRDGTDLGALEEEFLSSRSRGGGGDTTNQAAAAPVALAVSELEIEFVDQWFSPPYTTAEERNSFIRREQELVSFLEVIFRTETGIKHVHFRDCWFPLRGITTILEKATALKILWLVEISFMCLGSDVFTSILRSIQTNQIENLSVKDVALCSCDIGVLSDFPDSNNEYTHYILEREPLFDQSLHDACPNIEKFEYNIDDQTPGREFDWRSILCYENLMELRMSVCHKCTDLLNALIDYRPMKLKRLKIEVDPNMEECGLLADFLTLPQDEKIPSLKEINYQFSELTNIEEEDREEAILGIIQSLATHDTLQCFRLANDSWPRDGSNALNFLTDDGRWGLNDRLAEALLESVRSNPRLVRVNSSYESPSSGAVKSIQIYCTIHRHQESFLLEEDSNKNNSSSLSSANRLLLIHTLGLFRYDLDYLFCLLQTNPAICCTGGGPPVVLSSSSVGRKKSVEGENSSSKRPVAVSEDGTKPAAREFPPKKRTCLTSN